MTNFERIKGMNVETFATFMDICKIYPCMYCYYHYIKRPLPCRMDCVEGKIKWLESEVAAMSKAVLISVKPEWCAKIANGKKTIEVRKTRPKIETPFKCYIYCTSGTPYLNWHNGKVYIEEKDTLGGKGYGLYQRLNRKVIGEFVCRGVYKLYSVSTAEKGFIRYEPISDGGLRDTCLTMNDLIEYGKGKPLYAWFINNLKIYDKPKELSEFTNPCKHHCDLAEITKPPQSWCYVKGE